MKLQDRLPDSVIVRGKRVRLDLDFRNVLKLMEILADDSLMPDARTYLACKCICKRTRHPHEVLYEAKKILFPESRSAETKDAPKITDYVQDAPLIRAAFRQVYNIDLFTDKLHWLEFTELLNELPEGNRYIEVVGIRARPLPSPTKYNAKEREWLIKAKAQHALHMSDAEQEKFYNKAVKGIFDGIMHFVEGGGNNNE